MTTKNQGGPKKKQPSPKEIGDALGKGIEGADELSAKRMARVIQLCRKRSVTLARASAEFGQDHPRGVVLQKHATAGRRLERSLKIESARRAAPAPEIDDDTWTVHGHVFLPGLDLAEGVCVSLSSPTKRKIESVGVSITDGAGYFKLQHSRGPDNVLGGAGGKDRKDPKQPIERARAFLQVHDGKDNLLFRGDECLIARAGVLDYRSVVLDTDPSAVDDLAQAAGA